MQSADLDKHLGFLILILRRLVSIECPKRDLANRDLNS